MHTSSCNGLPNITIMYAVGEGERGLISRGTYGKVKLYLDRVACLARRLASMRALYLNIVTSAYKQSCFSRWHLSLKEHYFKHLTSSFVSLTEEHFNEHQLKADTKYLIAIN